MSTTQDASTAGRALYHAAWEIVGRKFFDTERLKDWTSWEHRFDELIDSESSARGYIAQMVASLGDTYTRLLDITLGDEADTASGNEAVEVEQVTETRNDVMARRFPGNIGYIRIFSFEHPGIVEQVTEGAAAIADCDAFIIDLRDNGGGAVDAACSCCELFVPKGGVGSIKRRLPDGRMWHRDVGLVDEGILFITKVTGEEDRLEGFMRRQPININKPVVVLINENTGSSAEMMAAAIIESDKESGLVTCVGVPSFGKGIAQQKVTVLDKLVIQITTAHFMSPTDVWFGDAQQSVRNPVNPDVHVESDGDRGPNAQLDAAFRHLTGRLAKVA